MKRVLDPSAIELRGQHLIEASAGTGKTYNITLLYLRLLLERELSVRQIAVVTFTKPATRELQGRLRARIAEARARLDAAQESPTDDLERILAPHRASEAALANARILLNAALINFDEARISTLHGLCRRLLAEHAFEAGLPFIELDDDAGKQAALECFRDFWRRHVMGTPDEAAAMALARWKTPEKMSADLQRAQVLAVPASRVDPVDAEAWVERLRKERSNQHQRYCELHANGQLKAAMEQLRAAIASKRLKSAETSVLSTASVQACSTACAADPQSVNIAALAALRSSSIQTQTSESAKKANWQAPKELIEVAEVIEALVLAEQALGTALLARFTRNAIEFVRKRLAEVRTRLRRFGFDDLIGQLHERLHTDGGDALAAAIARDVPALLVDEFQDTDTMQYAILHRIFSAGEGVALLLIGDPKQAIYRFRGGDIYTYRAASRDADDNRHTLRENFRSDARVILAVNALFGGVEDPFKVNFIGFEAAEFPAKRVHRKHWLETDSPLTVWRMPDRIRNNVPAPWTVGDFSERILGEVASSIRKLLDEAAQGAHAAPRIAVLVNTNRQAEAAAQELGRWNLSCDYLSTESVFAGDQARELEYLLAALDAPADTQRVRAALATELLGRSLDDLLVSRDALDRWEAELGLIAELRQRWLEVGPYATLAACIKEAAQRLLPRWDGRRVITNFLHLAELLQAESMRKSSPGELLHWLGQRRSEAEQKLGPGAAEQLRPADDGAAVEVLTIHRSKGLEFDVVYAPFIQSALGNAGAKPGSRKESVIWHQGDELRIDIGGPDWETHAEAQKDEQFAESLRLAYVAVTRARHRVWIAWAYVNVGQHGDSLGGPLPWLWGSTDSEAAPATASEMMTVERTDACLAALVKRSANSIRIEPLDMQNMPQPVLPTAPEALPQLEPAVFRGHIDRRLETLSYSRLFGGGQHAPVADHDESELATPPIASTAIDDPVPQKPSGAEFGTCVHKILEQVAFADLARSDHAKDLVRIAQDCGYTDGDIAIIARMLRECVSAELLPGSGFALKTLASGEFLAELEFLFPLGAARLSEFERVLASFPAFAREPGELQARRARVQGLMIGFIDLVVRWQDRYYVLDYKTNLLGPSRSDYAVKCLPAAIRSSDYDLQYLVYLVALQRFLRVRLGKQYDYETHVGGALYLYVRGMRQGDRAGIHHDRPPVELIDALDVWFSGEAP